VNDHLRVGIVGAGFMGETHLTAWAAEGNPAAIFDLDPTRAGFGRDRAAPMNLHRSPRRQAVRHTEVVSVRHDAVPA
jgi:predicted dehydrogenase